MSEVTARPRIAVVGTGWWSWTAHLPGLADYDGARLAALCDGRTDRLRAAGERFGVEALFADVAELVADGPAGPVDGVVVATPHTTHHAIARTVLDAGLPVLVEKPLTVTPADAWDLVARAEEAGVALSVGYTSQYVEPARRARDWLRQGRIGDLVQVVAHFSSGAGSLYAAAEEDSGLGPGEPGTGGAAEASRAHPRTFGADLGGGQAQTQLTHVAGMLCWQTGCAVEEVFAYADHTYDGRRLGVDVTDALTFRLAGGVVGVAASTGVVSGETPPRHDLRYHGTRGLLEYDMVTSTARLYDREGVTEVAEPGDQQAYPREDVARRFADLVAGRGDNHAPGPPAAEAVGMVDAALRSARSGRPERTWRPGGPPRGRTDTKAAR